MESDIKHIVTHGGPVYRGEFLAICLCLANANGNPTVYRREPTEEDLNDPHVIVLDAGKQYDPKKLNFDSHGFPRDCDPACAFSLVALELGIDEWVRRSTKWLPVTEMLDTRGPLGLNKMFPKDCENCGTPHFLDWKVLSQMLMSPVEGYFLRKLGELPELKVADENGCGNMLYAFMMDLGGDILEHSMEFADRTSYLDKNVQVFVVEGVEVIMVPAELRGDRPTMALDEWRMEKHPNARIAVTPDTKGAGWSFFRTSDTKRVDLSGLKERDDISFAHHGGFIAKTKELCDLPTIREMLASSIREPVVEKAPMKRWGTNHQGQGNKDPRPHHGQHHGHRHQNNRGGNNGNNGGGQRPYRPQQRQNQPYQQQQRPQPGPVAMEPSAAQPEEWSPPNPFVAQAEAMDHTAV